MDDAEESNLSIKHPPLRRTGQELPNLMHTTLFPTNSIIESLPDSCYSSCSEIISHPALSRETSGVSINAFHMEFGAKLGYSSEQIQMVLQILRPNPSQDEVLSELVKLSTNDSNKERQYNAALRSRNTPTLILSSDSPVIQPKLRPIVIDGSNIAMHHGRKEFFSCQGIRECVNFFQRRGHREIFVFLPQYRRGRGAVLDQHILFELEAEGYLIWTPSRRVNGKLTVCHDDRYILATAYEKHDSIIVSNDQYRDLVREHPEYKQMVSQRLLMYSFVDGKFMPPQDPLGKRGPKLDRFLQVGYPFTMQPCPYAKKCTYGIKCKYFHPERLNGMHISTTERLLNKKQSLSARPSMAYEERFNRQIEQNSLDISHDKLTRAQSLNLPNNEHPIQTVNQHQFLQPNILHQTLNRHISAPQDESQFGSMSSSTLNQSQQSLVANDRNIFLPSKSIWGNSEFSLGHEPISLNNEQSNSENQTLNEIRQRIQYNLSQIFPESSVIAVLNAHPTEINAQKLCERLLAFQSGFNS